MATVTSTVPASAVGTEILRRAYITDLNSDADEKLIDGASNYTYTVLSVTFCDGSATGTAEQINMWIMGSGSTRIDIISKADLPATGTYVFNDKFMLAETDELLVGVQSSADIDVYCTYIEQRWA